MTNLTNEQKLAAQKESWNTFAKGWKKWDDFIVDWLGPVGEKMIDRAQIKSGDTVLDTATGTGEPGLTAARRFSDAKVAGSDASEEMVAIANEKAKSANIANFEAIVAPTSALPFGDGSFDAVLNRYGVIFAPDVQTDIEEIVRVTKSGGRIVIAAWAEPAKNPWATTIPKMIASFVPMTPPPPDSPGIFRFPEADSLSAHMGASGIGEIVVDELTGEMVLESAEKYWTIMLDVAAPIMGALKGVDPSIVEQIHQKTIATINEHYLRDGKVKLPWAARVVSGKKA